MTRVAILIFMLLFCGGFGRTFQDTKYVVTDLGVLSGHQSSQAFSINNDGVVVGECTQGFLTQHAFLWKKGATMTAPVQFVGGGQTIALSISDFGHIIGTHYDRNGQCHGWIFQDNQMRDIGNLGGTFCAPYAVNGKGIVVGVSHDSEYQNHAFVWNGEVMTDLFPHSDFSVATDINECGDIVGYFQNDSGASIAFLRYTNGMVVDLGNLGGQQSSAMGVNDVGQIVGSSYLANGHRHAFLFENGEMRDLGTLRNVGGGFDTKSEAFEINNHGVVIGESVSLGAPARAFVWSRAEGMRDLQSLMLCPTGAPTSHTPHSFHLERVSDINDSGQIVGWGYFGEIDGDGNKPPTHAVILTPVSCPQALHNFSTKETK